MLTESRLPHGIETYLIPLIKYHSRWKELKKRDFVNRVGSVPLTVFNGHPLHSKVVPQAGHLIAVDFVSPYPVCENSYAFLKRFKALTDEYGCKLLLITAPRIEEDVARLGRYKSFYNYASCLGVDILDLNAASHEYNIDTASDFYDPGHMNMYGAEKASRYFAKYVAEKFEIKPDLTEEEEALWNNMFSRYVAEKKKAIEKENKQVK